MVVVLGDVRLVGDYWDYWELEILCVMCGFGWVVELNCEIEI